MGVIIQSSNGWESAFLCATEAEGKCYGNRGLMMEIAVLMNKFE